MKPKTIRVVIGNSIQEVPLRHEFACFPPDRLPCDIIDFGRDFRVRLTERLYFTAPGLSRGWHIISEGFKCDSVSTGRGAGRAILGRGKNARAGLIHDALYAGHIGEELSRKDCDLIFYQALRYGGTAVWRAKLAYWAVRLCGAKYYRTAQD